VRVEHRIAVCLLRGVRSGGRALSSRRDGGGLGLGRGSQGQAKDQVHGNDEQSEIQDKGRFRGRDQCQFVFFGQGIIGSMGTS